MCYCGEDFVKKKKNLMGASKMDQWVKVPVVKPANLNVIPRTHMVEGEKGLLQDVL